MLPEAWITIGVIALCLFVMGSNKAPPDITLVGGVSILLGFGIITPTQALAGFSNEGMITVGVLFVVVAGLNETGAIQWLGNKMLGRPKSIAGAQTRLMLPVSVVSAFLNNTPVVAMLIPAVADWAKKNRLPVSKLMIPLSYATIAGGTCTLIGTSTNLVVASLVAKDDTLVPLQLFDLVWIGVPLVIATFVYVLLASPKLLPNSESAASNFGDVRKYIVEMMVTPHSSLEGQSIEKAGLRHLPGLYLVEIERDGESIPAVSPQQTLKGNDRLIFAGVVDSVVDLQKIRGLAPATDQVFKIDAPRSNRALVETVIAANCPLIGKTVREGRFRTVYDAAIIAVSRNGQPIEGTKIGDIILQPGDTLLLEAHRDFSSRHKNSRDFYLVSQLEGSTPPEHNKALLALAILAAMIIVVGFGFTSMLKASLFAAGAMIITRCVRARVARRQIDWQLLVTIGASFGLSAAIETTGLAAQIGNLIVDTATGSPWLALAVLFLATTTLTEIATNNTAAVIMFPIAIATAHQVDAAPMPFVVALMVAASCSFATPIGYQTNLMVYGPGGYKFSDYLKFGIPLNILLGGITVALVPFIWGF